MRTTEEILNRIRERQPHDACGFEWPYYLGQLPFDKAKPHLKDGVKAEEWPAPKTDEQIKTEAIEYMPFAWQKANDCRGISAYRSLAHYMAWLWLLGEDEFDDIQEYEFYGKPQLERICAYFGLDPKQWDDGSRTNVDG